MILDYFLLVSRPRSDGDYEIVLLPDLFSFDKFKDKCNELGYSYIPVTYWDAVKLLEGKDGIGAGCHLESNIPSIMAYRSTRAAIRAHDLYKEIGVGIPTNPVSVSCVLKAV